MLVGRVFVPWVGGIRVGGKSVKLSECRRGAGVLGPSDVLLGTSKIAKTNNAGICHEHAGEGRDAIGT